MTTVFSVDGLGQIAAARASLLGRLSIGLERVRAALVRLRLTVMEVARFEGAADLEDELMRIGRSYEATQAQVGTADAMALAALELEAGRLEQQSNRAIARLDSSIATATADRPAPPESGVVKSAAVPVALAVGAGVLGLLFIASRP